MGRIFKWMGTREQARELWENREALNKYLARLKELMQVDEGEEGLRKPDKPLIDNSEPPKPNAAQLG